MSDAQRFGQRPLRGRTIVTETKAQLIEEGQASRLAGCQMFRGDLKSLIASSLSILGADDEIAAITEYGQTLLEASQRLEDAGVCSRITQGDSLEDVAIAISENSALVLAVNAGDLLQNPAFFDCGHANQLVMPVYSYRNPETLELVGFKIHYPGREPYVNSGFVATQTLKDAWLETGGRMLIATNENIFPEYLS